MKMLSRTPKPNTVYRVQPQKAGPVLAVQQSDDGIEYLLARPEGKQWQIESTGLWRPTGETNSPQAVWDAFFEQGLNEFDETSGAINGRKLLLCLRRPVIDFCSVQVVEADGVDLTEQVHNQIAILERMEPDDLVIDYACQAADAKGQRQTFVASLARETWERWQSQLRLAKCKPSAAIPRVWAVHQLVQDQTTLGDEPTLLLALYRKQADLVVLCDGRPIFVRSINLQQPEETAAVAQQLLSEIRLTAGTVDLPGDEQSVAQAVILGEADFVDAVATALENGLEISTQTLKLEQLSGFSFTADLPSSDVVPLLGMLSSFTKTPDLESIDLMNPKMIVRPPSRWRIYGWVAALLLAGLGYWGFDLWQTYGTNQQALKEQADKLKEARATLDRTLPRARVAEYLQRWDAEKVNWLQQLNEITQRLPSGDDVVVRQYDGKRTATGADISMQIQVRDLEGIAAIDQAIRDSGWKPQFRRVVETQDAAFPFRLESTISYTQEPDAGDGSAGQ